MSWYKNTTNIISVCLCVVTCILAFNYWSISKDAVILDAKVRVCNQKELDFNGVATECKKRINELHDKISILNSDKEVIATQKNSLFELASARQQEVNEYKRTAKGLEEEKSTLEQQISQYGDLQSELTAANSQNQILQDRVAELERRVGELDEEKRRVEEQRSEENNVAEAVTGEAEGESNKEEETGA